MLPVIHFPSTQTVMPNVPLQPEAVTPVPSQLSKTMTFQAVGANTQPVAVYNNIRLADDPLTAPQPEPALGLEQVHSQDNAAEAMPIERPQAPYSSGFLAQAMAQPPAIGDISIYLGTSDS